MLKHIKKTNFLLLNWIVSLSNIEENKSTSKDEKNSENDGMIDFAVGGQAVIEGVMMRSPSSITIAVRKPDNSIIVDEKHYKTITQRFPKLNVPIVRGVINLFEMMVIGTKAINYSANESLDEPPKKEEPKKEPGKFAKAIEITMFSFSMVFAFAFSLFLFKFLPLWVTTFLEGKSEVIADNYIIFNIIDGVLKMLIFLTYIFLLSLIPSFRRVFEYHGAEHKSIFNYEVDLPLTVENAKKQTRFHPRCGTSFILIVFVISILFYTFVPKQEVFLMNFALRAVLLPFVAGISYEYLKFSAKHVDKKIVKAMVAPGLWFQKLTTKEPKDDQLEVGLTSLKAALAMESAATKK